VVHFANIVNGPPIPTWDELEEREHMDVVEEVVLPTQPRGGRLPLVTADNHWNGEEGEDMYVEIV